MPNHIWAQQKIRKIMLWFPSSNKMIQTERSYFNLSRKRLFCYNTWTNFYLDKVGYTPCLELEDIRKMLLCVVVLINSLSGAKTVEQSRMSSLVSSRKSRPCLFRFHFTPLRVVLWRASQWAKLLHHDPFKTRDFTPPPRRVTFISSLDLIVGRCRVRLEIYKADSRAQEVALWFTGNLKCFDVSILKLLNF